MDVYVIKWIGYRIPFHMLVPKRTSLGEARWDTRYNVMWEPYRTCDSSVSRLLPIVTARLPPTSSIQPSFFHGFPFVTNPFLLHATGFKF